MNNNKKMSLITQIMIGLALGIMTGALLKHFPEQQHWIVEQILRPAGDAFIKLMKMIIVPLVFTCMVVGIAGNGGRSLGRMGARSLVIPLGYSFNLDGASLFAGLGTLFIAQVYNIDLSVADQAMLVLIMVLTSKGAAGVPGFMFVILTATLTTAGLPVEGVALIAGVYRLMDMPITALNVLGNALAPLVIAKWEGSFRRGQATPLGMPS